MSDLIQIQVKPKAASTPKPTLDIEALKERVQQSRGQEYWRSLEELAGHPDFEQLLAREFPTAPREMMPLRRRDFMKLMGASLAMAGLAGCAFQPQEKIVPYVKAPDDVVPGIPQFYATAFNFGGFAQGVLAESNMGRPTKIEGNPDHPDSGLRPNGAGATDAWMQAYILGLYDPDRSQSVLHDGSVSSWEEFLGAVQGKIDGTTGGMSGLPDTADAANAIGATNTKGLPGGLQASGGQGLRILTGTITSPTLLDQIASLRKRFPKAQWHHYEPVSWDNIYEGAQLAFGVPAQPVYDLTKADVILSLDANFLYDEPNHLALARDWSSRRRVIKDTKGKTLNRTYVAESSPTITGIKAEHRMPMQASRVEGFARAVAARLGLTGFDPTASPLPNGVDTQTVDEMVKDLQGTRGKSTVIAGYAQPPSVHALAHAMNLALGNVGQTVRYVQPVIGNVGTSQMQSLTTLVNDMRGGKVDTLLILGGNPCYDAPSDLDFLGALKKVSTSIHMGAYEDETAAWCHWHIPESHPLEAWSDLRSYDGTTTIVQPLIEPLYTSSRNAHELLAPFTNNPLRGSYDIVRSTYLKLAKQGANITGTDGYSGQGSIAFEKLWQTIIHDGTVPTNALVASSKAATLNVSLKPDFAATLPNNAKITGGMEIIFRPDPCVWDGRFSNNVWLQELPKPLTKLTWDNAALMSVATAQKLNLDVENMATLTLGGRELKAAVYIVPGHPNESVTLHLGYGRTRAGQNGTVNPDDSDPAGGFNAYKLRTSKGMWHEGGLQVVAANTSNYQLARTDHYNLIDTPEFRSRVTSHIIDVPERQGDAQIDGTHGRELIRGGTITEFRDNDHAFVSAEHQHTLPMIPTYLSPNQYEEQQYVGDKANQPKSPIRYGVAESPDEGPTSLYPRENDRVNRFKDNSLNQNQGSDPDHPNPDDAANARQGINPEARPYGWGMSIDLSTCIGCNACVVACQSENNTATVGKEQVAMGRWLHWLRIDTYYKGSYENPAATFQPVMCMHCEKAPCEPVCPVNAAVHSPEGINEQVYNRCIGTRYCANNCPYKVRRFNYLQYSEQDQPTIMLMHNPDVTVRSRGVMEKCNFCIQRVNAGKFQAEKENRQLRDGEVVTACQGACPTNAIVFGNLNDPGAAVTKLKKEPHNYGLLTDLNVFPRVSYLAKIENPNPKLPFNSGALEPEKEEVHAGANHAKGGEGHAANNQAPARAVAQVKGEAIHG